MSESEQCEHCDETEELEEIAVEVSGETTERCGRRHPQTGERMETRTVQHVDYVDRLLCPDCRDEIEEVDGNE